MATRQLLFVDVDGNGFVYQDSSLSSADVVDFQGAQLSNIKDPVAAQDAATMGWVQAQLANNDDFQRVAQAAVPAFTAVYYSSADQVSACDSSNLAKVSAIGFTTASIAPAATGTVRPRGVLSGCLTGATVNTPYYIGHAGTPVLYSALVHGDRIIQAGFAKNATDLELEIHDTGNRK